MLAVEILLLFAGIVFLAAASELQPEGKIVGGKDADIKDFPYHIQVSLDTRNYVLGGGCIISKHWVLTAAHLFIALIRGSTMEDTLGSIYLHGGADTVSMSDALVVYSVEEIHMELYNDTTQQNDIALLKVDGEIEYSPSVQPINLPAKDMVVEPGTVAVITGWGKLTQSGRRTSAKLQQVEMTVMNVTTCYEIYKEDHLDENMQDPDQLICTEPGQDKGTCQGDSGGPLVSNHTVIGIVTWGVGCANPKYPDVYTKVAAYIDWIKKTTAE